MSKTLSNKMHEHFLKLLPYFRKNMDENNPSIKIEILLTLKRLLRNSKEVSTYQQSLPEIQEIIVKGINDDYFRTVTEGLNAAAGLTRLISFDPNKNSAFIPPLADVIHKRLEEKDIDQEVKQMRICA